MSYKPLAFSNRDAPCAGGFDALVVQVIARRARRPLVCYWQVLSTPRRRPPRTQPRPDHGQPQRLPKEKAMAPKNKK